MSQTGGRREGESPVWEIRAWKIVTLVVVPIITGVVILWAGWVSRAASYGEAAANDVAELKVDMEKMDGILHRRITDLEIDREAKVQKLADKLEAYKAAQDLQTQAIMNQLLKNLIELIEKEATRGGR